MSVQIAALCFIFFWLLLANGAWFVPLGTLLPNALGYRFILWLIANGFALATGAIIDGFYRNAPHEAWITPAFYGIYFSLAAVFSLPGYLFWRSKKARR